jgi:DNA polymerase III sliding clamp (beta) subunit (PCNA family)
MENTMLCRLIDAKYPAYENVIPKKTQTYSQQSRLQKSIKRLPFLQIKLQVKLCFDKRNSLTIEDKIIIIKRSKRLRLRTR